MISATSEPEERAFSVPRALNGMLLPLDEFIEQEGIDMEEMYIPGSKTTCAFGEGEDQKWYTLPMSRTLYPVYYNKDMFEAARIPEADSDWTFDDLRKSPKNSPAAPAWTRSLAPGSCD